MLNLGVIAGIIKGFMNPVKNEIQEIEQSSAKVINANKKRRPLMTFIDDDGRAEFYTIWKGICEDKNIRVDCAIISGNVGGSNMLTWDQIEELHNDNLVEFVNHTKDHVALADKTKSYVYEEVNDCITALKNHGIDTGDILVYPFGQNDENAIDAIKGICRCAITTDKGSEITYNIPTLATFSLWRNELVESDAVNNPTLAWMKEVVDTAVEKNAWVIWMSHSQYAGFTPDMIANIKSLIDYATEKNVDIVTVGEALEIFGNVFETGAYKNGGRANGFVVGCDGTTYGRGANFEEDANTYLFHTPIENYPRNSIIANNISGNGAVGFPMDGCLITVTAPTTLYEYKLNSYQMFKVSSTSDFRLYTRGFASDGLPNDFHLQTKRSGASTNRPGAVDAGYEYFDTTLGKPIFSSKTCQRAWYKLVITAGTTSAGNTRFAGTSIALDAGMTKEQVRDAVAEYFLPQRTSVPVPGLLYYLPEELGLEDDGVTLYCMRSAYVDYTLNLYVDPISPDTGCRGTYTRLRDGVAPAWVDATGTAV